ncbi:hypothetical protein I3760_05G258200 [Carya illinoinensis]|nr:hypothetical protein I3760_05G258200 [Carya illinoinensis]
MSKATLSNFRTKLCLQLWHSLREGISTTHDKKSPNYQRVKDDKSRKSCYIDKVTLKDKGVSMAKNSAQNGSLTR